MCTPNAQINNDKRCRIRTIDRGSGSDSAATVGEYFEQWPKALFSLKNEPVTHFTVHL